jgi:hypothetical protein
MKKRQGQMLSSLYRYFFPQPLPAPQPDSACGAAFTSCDEVRHKIGSVTRGGQKYSLYCDGWDDQMIERTLMKKAEQAKLDQAK